MNELPHGLRDINWEVTTWEGARREQLRRWARLPLDRIIASLEEMSTLAEQLGAVGEGPIRSVPTEKHPPDGLRQALE